MDLSFSAEDEAFRQEVRAFIDDNLTDEMRLAGERTIESFSEFEIAQKWKKALYRKGWGATSWPVEYGGTGWTTVQHYIFSTELARAHAPSSTGNGPGPCVIGFGTPEQKERFLEPACSGEHIWAQGYSEPQAGSDLAALQTRAVLDGDDYVVNGSKIWTTNAHHANWLFTLVRTSTEGKKQAGITFLLIELKSPGVEIRPIINTAGEHEFNQVFFTDVRVPVANRLGEENEGWTVGKHFLKFEHGGTGGRAARLNQRLDRVRNIARLERADDGLHLVDDEDFRRALSRVDVEIQAIDFLELRLMSKASKGEPLGTEGSFIRIRASEVMQRLTELGMEAMAYYCAPFQPELSLVHTNEVPVAPEHGMLETLSYFVKRAETIYGGTVEVHHDIIAKRLLGI